MDTSISLQKVQSSHLIDIRQILSKWLLEPDGSLDEVNFTFLSNLIEESIGNENSREHFLVAVNSENKILGILGYAIEIFPVLKSYAQTEKPIQITVLMIDKDRAGIGVGTQMIREFEKWAKGNAYLEIVLTSSEKWKESWEFYKKLEYEDLGEMENNKNFHTKIFRKDLV